MPASFQSPSDRAATPMVGSHQQATVAKPLALGLGPIGMGSPPAMVLAALVLANGSRKPSPSASSWTRELCQQASR